MLQTVHFHAIAAGGEAVGRDARNRAVFAPFGAPGDIAQVEIEEERATFARGQIQHLSEVSPLRVAPPCPFFRPAIPAQSCGGCQIQHLNYQAQLNAKRDLVRDAFERIGKIQNAEIGACIGSPREWNYRNKADFVVGTREQKPEIGFFAAQSHDLIDVDFCPLQIESNNRILQIGREILARNPNWAFDAQSGRGAIRRLVARTSTDGKSLLVAVVNRVNWPDAREFARQMPEKTPSLVGVLMREMRGETKLIAGQNWLEETVGDLRLRATGDGFFQVNPFLTPILVETALGAENWNGLKVLDLFCGVGLFALALARRGADVVGIEANRQAIQDAQFNARNNGLKAAFHAQAAEKSLGRFCSGELDAIFLDPPRAGAANCMEKIADLRPKSVVYVSCDPATLARDAKQLVARGFALQRAIPLDLFPQTAHVETVARFARRENAD